MNPIQEIEKTTGFEKQPAESVSEYLSRLGAGAGVDEGEVASVRDAIHTDLYSKGSLPESEREAIRSFARTVSENATAADVRPDPTPSGREATSGVAYGSGSAGVGSDRERTDEEVVEDALESVAVRWDETPKRSRRKVLAGVGVLGTLGVGAAVAGIGGVGGNGRPASNGTATTGTGAASATVGTRSGDATAEDGTGAASEGESTTARPAEPVPRTTLSEAEVEIEGFELRQLAREDWPQPVPAECQYSPDQAVSANNLAYRDDGSTVDPLASARNVLGMVQCYEQSDEDVYLQKATEMATALYEAGESYESGQFFPHEYAVRPHGDADVDWAVRAPWYSATTQGVALSAFARLYTHSLNESVWMYAEEVLRSFDTIATRADGPPAENPWTACLDDGYLWLEKYAQLPASHVLSGMSLAAWGLYEQWMALQSSLARELFRASATTVKAYAEEFRNAGGPSYYCLGHDVPAPEYHSAHIRQLRAFHSITGDGAFAEAADQFESDAESAG